jgi:hypothetical protein
MRRHHFKLVLLSLGVVLGYGSAFAHFHHAHHGGSARLHECEHWLPWSDGPSQRDAAKKVQ